MVLVLDASVALAWFVTETPESNSYADGVADELSMSGSLALVPISFNLECAIVLRRERNRRNLSQSELEGAFSTLDRLPIEMHDFRYSVRDILRLAGEYELHPSDVLYVKLAELTGLRLATLDEAIRVVCRDRGIALY